MTSKNIFWRRDHDKLVNLLKFRISGYRKNFCVIKMVPPLLLLVHHTQRRSHWTQTISRIFLKVAKPREKHYLGWFWRILFVRASLWLWYLSTILFSFNRNWKNNRKYFGILCLGVIYFIVISRPICVCLLVLNFSSFGRSTSLIIQKGTFTTVNKWGVRIKTQKLRGGKLQWTRTWKLARNVLQNMRNWLFGAKY